MKLRRDRRKKLAKRRKKGANKSILLNRNPPISIEAIQPLVPTTIDPVVRPSNALAANAQQSGKSGNDWPGVDVDRYARKVSRNGVTAQFGKKDKPFSLFIALFDNASGLARSKVIAILWPDRAVTDNAFDQHKGAAEELLLPLKIEIISDSGIWKLSLR